MEYKLYLCKDKFKQHLILSFSVKSLIEEQIQKYLRKSR